MYIPKWSLPLGVTVSMSKRIYIGYTRYIYNRLSAHGKHLGIVSICIICEDVKSALLISVTPWHLWVFFASAVDVVTNRTDTFWGYGTHVPPMYKVLVQELGVVEKDGPRLECIRNVPERCARGEIVVHVRMGRHPGWEWESGMYYKAITWSYVIIEFLPITFLLW